MDVMGEGEVESIDDRRFRDNGSVNVVRGGVDLVIAGKGIGGGEFRTWENFPENIEVLQEKGPAGLSTREFMGVFDVRQVFKVSDDSNQVRCSLDVLAPLGESEDDCKQFPVIDVVVPLSRKEGTREIGAGMEVTVGISLEQDGSCCEQGGIGHD